VRWLTTCPSITKDLVNHWSKNGTGRYMGQEDVWKQENMANGKFFQLNLHSGTRVRWLTMCPSITKDLVNHWSKNGTGRYMGQEDVWKQENMANGKFFQLNLQYGTRVRWLTTCPSITKDLVNHWSKNGTGKYGEWKDLSTEFTFWDKGEMAHYVP